MANTDFEDVRVIDNDNAEGLDTQDTSVKPEDGSEGDGASLLEAIEDQFKATEDDDDLILDSGSEEEAGSAEDKPEDDETDDEDEGDEDALSADADNAAEAADKPDGEANQQDEKPVPWQKLVDSGDFTDKDIKRLRMVSSATRRKIEGIIDERDAGRKSTSTLNEFNGYLSKNGISSQDLNQALTIAAAWKKGDLKAFREAIDPMIRFADEYLGNALPDDLAQKVQEGHMTEEVARDFARERHERAMHQQASQVAQQQTAAHSAQMSDDARASAVQRWDQDMRQRDPDFAVKAPMIQEILVGKRAELVRMTPQQAIQECDRVYQRVNTMLKDQRLRPQRKATQRTPNSSVSSSSAATPAPDNMFEAALKGLQNTRR